MINLEGRIKKSISNNLTRNLLSLVSAVALISPYNAKSATAQWDYPQEQANIIKGFQLVVKPIGGVSSASFIPVSSLSNGVCSKVINFQPGLAYIVSCRAISTNNQYSDFNTITYAAGAINGGNTTPPQITADQTQVYSYGNFAFFGTVQSPNYIKNMSVDGGIASHIDYSNEGGSWQANIVPPYPAPFTVQTNFFAIEATDFNNNKTKYILEGINLGGPDSDGDRYTDAEEILIHKTDPRLADTDGDGMLDRDELEKRYDPLNAQDKLSIKQMTFSNGENKIMFNARPFNFYTLEKTISLENPFWFSVDKTMSFTDGDLELTDIHVSDSGYYRIRAE